MSQTDEANNPAKKEFQSIFKFFTSALDLSWLDNAKLHGVVV